MMEGIFFVGAIRTFFVITKLVPAKRPVSKCLYKLNDSDSTRSNIPIAKLEVMANAKPIYL